MKERLVKMFCFVSKKYSYLLCQPKQTAMEIAACCVLARNVSVLSGECKSLEFNECSCQCKSFHYSRFKTIPNTRNGFDQIGVTIELLTDLSNMHIDRSIYNVNILSPHRIQDRYA